MRAKSAFTLVEILVVIAIIAVIAAIAYPVMARAKISALETRSVSNMRQVHLAIELYRADYSGAPVGSMEAMGLPLWPSAEYLGDYVSQLNPPKLPTGGIYYYYPAPKNVDHRNPTWQEYVMDNEDSTVLLADVWFNPEGPSGNHDKFYTNPIVQKYVFGITLGGSLRKKTASGHLDMAWWDR